MRRVRLGYDVYEAALQRLIELYAEGHTLVVSLSGGKDSGVCLELCIEAARQTGRLPVNACVQDEEVCYPGTGEYIERCARRPEVNFKWFCCHQPMVNIFDRANPYFWCFDSQLKPEQWVRQIPEDLKIENPEINIESIVHPKWFPVAEGKWLIDVVGLRVAESAKRMLGLVSSGGHLTGLDVRGGVPFRKVRPIYDWTDADVWKAYNDMKWDYNKAYDVMHRMGVPMKAMRIGPPTMTVHSADLLRTASKAWPKWFDKVCTRLRGVRQVAQFGSLVARPNRRINETWEQCYDRVCVQEAPADWIRQRSIILRDHLLAVHARHSTQPFPQTHSCFECGGAGIACWRRMTEVMFNGDPFSLRVASICKNKLPYIEPEFFRKGAGYWGGSPSW